MAGRITDLSYEGWVKYVFDRPISYPAWHWEIDRDWWDELVAPTTTLEYLTRLFESPRDYLAPYSDAQLNQGLWYLADASCSAYMCVLLDPHLDWQAQKQCIEAMYTLYARLFARRCTPHLSHLDEPGGSRLNGICYMWWDLLPIIGEPDNPARKALDETVLSVMTRILTLDNIACQEGALHGLGHWQMFYPERVQAIIGDFLGMHVALRPELKAYARRAREGCVL